MGWLSMNIALKADKLDPVKVAGDAEKGEKDPTDPASPETTNQENEQNLETLQRAELTGAARLLAEWPVQILRIVLWLLLGALLGLLGAVLCRLLLPQFFTPQPEPAPLHMASTNLTFSHACAVEALTRAHQQRPCHLVMLRSHPAPAVQLVYHLRNTYPNLNTHYHPDPEDFFESSPLDGFFKLGGNGGLMELAARTLALWRHGGVSVDLDRPVLSLPPSEQFVQQDGGALLQFPQPCHPALQGLLAALMGHDAHSTAEEAIQRATDWICGENSAPEDCLGVHVLKGGLAETLNCPLVRQHHEDSAESTSESSSEKEESTHVPEITSSTTHLVMG